MFQILIFTCFIAILLIAVYQSYTDKKKNKEFLMFLENKEKEIYKNHTNLIQEIRGEYNRLH